MINFPIEFSFQGIDYKAMVQRLGGLPLQYHVYEVQPTPAPELNFPYIIYVTDDKKNLEWRKPSDIGLPISAAILKACEEKGIPPHDQTNF
jgi:hypothetical protein